MSRAFKQTAAVMAIVASLSAGTAAVAQNYDLQPLFGTLQLVTGFLPDPAVVNVRAGGSTDAEESLGGNCRGFITQRPSVRVYYSAGDTYPLIISADSQADTTLVVNAPDGTWHCDDDSGHRALNPSIRFDQPDSGRYEVWVGTYRPGSANAQLNVSEVHSR